MKLAICLLAILAVLATGQVGFQVNGGAQKASASVLQSESAPKIYNAQLNGKKLYLTGENFSPGAVIMVNGVEQKTKNDSDNPTTLLIAKKAGKKMPSDKVVSLSVKNPTGPASEDFNFFKGLTVTLEDAGKTIELSVGDQFLLLLNRSPYKWTATVQNPAIITAVADAPPVMGAVAIFQAAQKGQTDLTAIGELACHNSNPPCMAPTLQFQVHLVVK